MDSDVIVNSNLDKPFSFDFHQNELLAAVKEIDSNSIFNDGVVVFNNKELSHIQNLTEKLLSLGKNDQLQNGDQSVINDYFAGKIRKLPGKYNYEIGVDRWAFL